MVDEKRLDTLQDEIKLLKAEVKNSLASVRDYLLNMELPSSEFSTILAALAGDDTNPQKMNVDSHVSDGKGEDIPKPDYAQDKSGNAKEGFSGEPNQPGTFEDLLDFEEADKTEVTPEGLSDEGTLFGEDSPMGKATPTPEERADVENYPDEVGADGEDVLPEETLPPEDGLEELKDDDNTEEENEEVPDEDLELPLEEIQPMENDRINTEANQGIPKVNMLANLINWVAKAKKEIGYEELPTFLDVYGVSGHLSPELKDVIIHLAEIAKDNPDIATDSEIWSQSILSLHGILTGGDAPLNPIVPSWMDTTDEAESLDEEEIIEIDKGKEKRAKLKLVLPSGNGKSKEFCIDLTPEDNGDGA